MSTALSNSLTDPFKRIMHKPLKPILPFDTIRKFKNDVDASRDKKREAAAVAATEAANAKAVANTPTNIQAARAIRTSGILRRNQRSSQNTIPPAPASSILGG